MQEDKEAVFGAIDTVKMCLPVFTNMLSTATFLKDNMLHGAKGGFSNATDAADYLTKKGVPFRDSHEILGRLVLYCIEKNCMLEDLTMTELKAISPVFGEDYYEAVTLESCVNGRSLIGGPAPAQTVKVIEINKKWLEENK